MKLSQKAMQAAGLDRPVASFAQQKVISRYTYTGGPMLYLGQQIVAQMQKVGWPAVIHTHERSASTQEQLYFKGVSKARAWQSAHQYGMAVDIIHAHKAWNIEERFWRDLAAAVHVVEERFQVDLTHGHFWKFRDSAHVELTDWRQWRQRWGNTHPDQYQYADSFAVVLPKVWAQHIKVKPQRAQSQPFRDAFAQARAAGLAVFEWRGGLYTTKLKETDT